MPETKYDTKRPVRRLGHFLDNERRLLYLILFYAMLYGAIGLVLPLGIQAIINFILAGRISTSWIVLIVVITIGLTISGVIKIVQMKLVERLEQRIFAMSAFELAVRIPRIKLEAIQHRYAPEFINQFFDTVNLQKGIAKLVIDYPTAALQVFFGLILISAYHPYFLFFSLIVALVLYLLFKFTGPLGIDSSLRESTGKYKVAEWLEELGRNMGTFKLAGITNLPMLKIDKLVSDWLHYRRRHFGILITQYKVMVVFNVLTVVALLILGSLLLIDNQISFGQFVAAEIVIILIMNSIEKLITGLASVYDTLTALEKLGMITDLPMEGSRSERARDLSGAHGFEIVTDDLTFQYPEADRPAISKMNLTIRPGEKIALVGTEGSGKSTFMQLLVGLYDAYDGRITYNDISLAILKHDALRSEIGDNIWQESIFAGTLRENLTLGREGIPDEMIRDLLRLVGAEEGINRLDKGLDTTLLTGGLKLPSTLTKKLMLARALLGDPKLLLLELESDFLTIEERERLVKFVRDRNWTALVSTRDMDVIRSGDRVIYMERGKVAFDGDFEQFKAEGYAKYFG